MEGRVTSLETLEAELAGARDGKRLITVGGEPGIGKTRLASEFAARARAEGAIVLYGRSSAGPDPPYGPFADALGHYLKHASSETLLEDEVQELARIAPGVGGGLPGLAVADTSVTGAQQFVLFGAVASVLERASQDALLVFVLEDLHWADEGSLLLLRYLMTGPAEISMLVVGTYRSTEVATDGPLAHTLAELSRDQEVSRVDLAALSQEDALLLLTKVAGRGLKGSDADLAGALHRESGGNPLFLTELVRALLAAGAIREDRGGWSFDEELRAIRLPSTLTEVIQQRVARLGSGVGDALRVAAVVGQEFDPELVERALDRSSDEMSEVWDAAERAGLIVEAEAGRFGFNHPLVERTLYEELGSRRRGALHRRLAEAIEAPGREGDVAEIASHWAAAVPAAPAKARLWAARAGRHALDRFDGSGGVEWYRRALELHGRSGEDDERTRCKLLIGLGTGQRQLGDPGFRDTLLEASRLAERLEDSELLVEAALLNNRGFACTSGQIDEERLAILESALRAVGDADSRERAHLLATLAVELTFSGQWERRAKMSDEALAIARRLGNRPALTYVLTVRFVTIWMPGTLKERLANTAEAVRLADELGDPWLQFHAVHWRFVGLVQSGALEEAVAATAREQELAGRLGDPTTRWISTYDRGNLAILAGRLDEAEELAKEAADIATRSGQPGALPMFTSQLTNIRYEQGRLSELQPLIAEVVAEYPGIPAFRAVLALAYTDADLRNEARNLLAIDFKTGFAEMPADVTWLGAHAIYGHVASDLGDRPAAAALYERLAPWKDQLIYTGISAWGDVDHALGRLATTLGRFEEAERRLGAAVERAARIGAPVWMARTQYSAARLLLARDEPGDRARAAELLDEAIAGARRTGAATVERRASSLREHQRALEVAAGAGQSGQRLRIRPSSAEVSEANGKPEPAGPPSRPAGKLEQEGDYWTVRLGDSEVRLRDNKGIRYLARLLSTPGVEMHAVDLQAGHPGPASASVGAAADADLSVRAAGAEDGGEMLDAEAKRRYRVRIDELREEIEEAERFNDPERVSHARDELEFLGRELAAAVGIGGRDRKTASQAERARVNVTRAIRNTIKRVSAYDESLGGLLEASVQTGTFCSYQPPPTQEVRWEIDGTAA